MGGSLGLVDQLGVPWEGGTPLVTLYLMTCFQIGLASPTVVSRTASLPKQLSVFSFLHGSSWPKCFELLYFETFSYQNVSKSTGRSKWLISFFDFM